MFWNPEVWGATCWPKYQKQVPQGRWGQAWLLGLSRARLGAAASAGQAGGGTRGAGLTALPDHPSHTHPTSTATTITPDPRLQQSSQLKVAF